jgi:hypothetical protein
VTGDKINLSVTSGEIKCESKWWFRNQQVIEHAKNLGNRMLSVLADVGAFYYMKKIEELFRI